MPEYTIYDVTASLFTPLHIGSGRTLLRDYDYAVHNGQTWRINETTLLDAQDVSDAALAKKLMEIPYAQLLRREDFHPGSPYFRYVLPGTPRSEETGAQVVEQIKDAWDQPYLPGSSIKGALRTAIAWHALGVMKMPIDRNRLKQPAKRAAQDIERRIFGQDPNHDLLRALHVSDSAPAGQDRLMLINAQVIGKRGAGSPIELEAIRQETTFQLQIKIDETLFTPWAESLGFGRKADWLRRLPAIVQRFAAGRLQQEEQWWRGTNHAGIADFYGELTKAKLGNSACFIQVGWGGGWDSKTFGSHLRGDSGLFEGIIRDYRLSRVGQRRKGSPFPASRRAIVSEGGPAAPLGWILLEFKERGS